MSVPPDVPPDETLPPPLAHTQFVPPDATLRGYLRAVGLTQVQLLSNTARCREVSLSTLVYCCVYTIQHMYLS